MKNLFIIFLISFSAMASNWMPISKIAPGQVAGYSLESICKSSSQEQCLDVGNEPQAVKEGFVSTQDLNSKNDVESCSSLEDCQSKHEAKICSDQSESSVKNLDLMEVYCSKLLGKSLSVDSAGWSAFKAGELAKSNDEAALAFAKNLRECGGRVMDRMLVRNQSKSLTVPQVAQLLSTYQPIQLQLSSGSLLTAKAATQAASADGVIVTENDKSSLIIEINKCLGL